MKNRLFATLFLLLFFTLALPSYAQQSFFTMTYAGLDRTYLIVGPPTIKANEALPLVVALHGAGGTGLDMSYSGLNRLALDEGYVVVYPDGLRNFWDYGTGLPEYKYDDAIDDAGFLTALLDEVGTKVTIDPERVYIVGYSNGAHMAYRMACVIPERITAIVSVSGAVSDFVANDCPNSDPVSVLMVHGTADVVVEYNGEELSHETTGEVLGHALSAPDGAKFWAEFNGCAVEGVEAEVMENPTVSRMAYDDCEGDAQVALYSIEGAGHGWPDQYFEQGVVGLISSFIGSNAVQTPEAESATQRESVAPADTLVLETQTLTYDELERQVHVHVPETLADGEALPLVIALHPSSSSGKAMAAISGFNQVAEEAGFIAAYPDSAEYFWMDGIPRGLENEPDDEGFIGAVIDYMAENYPVDTSRVYLTGYGNGGTMAYRMACNAPERFAGIAVVSTLMWDFQLDVCETNSGEATNLLIMPGSEDVNYPPEGKILEDGSIIVSLQNMLNFWGERFGCEATAQAETGAFSVPCANDTHLSAVVVDGGGHNWPRTGRFATHANFEGAARVWAFFSGDENWATVGETEPVASDLPPRSFTLYVPESYDGFEPLPLVVALHGRTGTGAGFAYMTEMNDVADAQNFIAVYPDGINREWNYVNGVSGFEIDSPVNDTVFLEALVDDLAQDLYIDRSRVYMTGFSNGGFMTYRLACETNGVYAAYATVGATLPLYISEVCNATNHTAPILMIHGTLDRVVPWDGIVENSLSGPVMTYLDIRSTVGYWVDRDECTPQGELTALAELEPDDGTHVQRLAYSGCKDNTEVILYGVQDGGHNWPGFAGGLPDEIAGIVSTDLKASEAIWEFFSNYRVAG